MYKRRVVITDMEIYSANGFLKDTFKKYTENKLVKSGEVEISEIIYPALIYFDDCDTVSIERTNDKTMTEATKYAYQTVAKIYERQKLTTLDTEKSIIGIVAGNTVSTQYSKEIYKTSDIFKALNNNTATNIAKSFNLNGSVIPNSASCATSLHSLILGYNEIISGNNDIMFVSGSDEWTPFMQTVFDKLNIASEDKCRPFFLNRNGTVIGDGASTFLLEELNHAMDRGATIYGEILGTCISQSSSLAYSTKDSILYTMNMALKNACEFVEDRLGIDVLDTHGTGTEIGDASEAEAINSCNYSNTKVVAWKYYLQHLLAAGGLAELAMTIMCLKRNTPLNDIRDIAEQEATKSIIRKGLIFPRTNKFYTIMKNSFGLGGINTSVVLRV